MDKEELREKLLVARNYYVNKYATRLVSLKPAWDTAQLNIPDIKIIDPYIDMCDTQAKRDLWFYGRITVSSAPWTGDVGRRFQYLIRDRNTDFILGMVGISSSLSIPVFDKHIGWTRDMKWKQHKINHTMNMSHCISTPQFSDYLTGKLCALSVMSTEVLDKFETAYHDKAVCFMTTSLFGKSSIYNRLQGFEYLGCTKGYSAALVDPEIKAKMRKEYQEKHGKHSEIYTKPDGTVVKYGCVKCYSDDTEVLTDNGWKLFSNLMPDDSVGTYNKELDCLEFQKPTNYYASDYTGKMLSVDSTRCNLLITPNHDLLTNDLTSYYYHGKELKRIQADQLNEEQTYVIKKDMGWEGTEQGTFVLPALDREEKMGSSTKEELPLKMDDWLEFMGWYLSEGCVADKYHTQIHQYDQVNLDKIEDCIKRLGFTYGRYERRIDVYGKQLRTYLSQFGGSYTKFIPKEIKQLSSRQLNILLASLCAGDGEKKKGVFVNYGSVSKQLADDVQEIAIKCGFATNMRTNVQPYKDGECTSYVVGLSRHYKNAKLLPSQRTFVDYSGKVYCVEVPNHYLVVRRKGKAVICGNTFQKLGKYATVQRVENLRGVYAIPLASNYKEFLSGTDTEIKMLPRQTFAELTAYWRERWLNGRIERMTNGT